MTICLAVLTTGSWARSIIRFIVQLGIFAPFLIEALDTSFLYLPLANELVLTALISTNDGPFWLIYPLMAALGAVLGVSILDLIARRMGEEGLQRFVSPERVKQLKAKLKNRSGWAILVVSLLPPPFPFRPLILTASALQSPRLPMLLGVFTGRLVRYTCEGILILLFGRRLLVFLESSVFEYLIYALTAITIVGSLLTLRVWMVKVEKRSRSIQEVKPR